MRNPLSSTRSLDPCKLAAALAAMLAGGLIGCSADPGPPRVAALADCRLPRLSSLAKCTEIEVPERRLPSGSAAAGDRKLRIHAAVLPANTLTPEPDPLFILAGGPGQAASSLAPLAAAFERVRRVRDIVLIDQRGTGRSSPLACKAMKPEDPLRSVVEGREQLRLIAECRREIEARGVDLTQYATAAFVADVDDVRRALGYSRVNLWGGSYGTRVAQEYLRRYPERVRSAVLDGVAPPGMRIPLDIWPSRDAALADVLAACSQASACAQRLGDVEKQLDDLRTRLATPISSQMRHPLTGEALTMPVSWETVIGALHALTYTPESASLVAVLVARAAEGDYAPLVAGTAWVSGRIGEDLNPALHYAVVCADDAPRIEATEAQRTLGSTRSEPLGRLNLQVCADWPRGPLDAGIGKALASSVPVLLLSGALDPVTPPANAEIVARTLANSRHVVAAGTGHGVSTVACVPDLVGAFVEDAGFGRMSQPCLDFLAGRRRPPAFVSPLGPDLRP